jgi:hypothetical protein
MTLPTGQITSGNVNTECGYAYGTGHGFSWIQSVTHPSYRTSYVNMNKIRGWAYYQKSNAGNCNNGNCGVNCNCACDYCQTNCVNCYAINCANCDGQRWIQPNCNCACTYVCGYYGVNYNCACCCNCNCGGG